jgi:rod shape determining protein RodA
MFYTQSSFSDLENLKKIHWTLLSMIFLACFVGIFSLFCLSQGDFYSWAFKQSIKILVGIFFLCFFARLPLRNLMFLGYIFYGFSLCLLIGVELFGRIGMGAKRWINLGVFELQPSELMKITLLLALANYLHHNPLDMEKNSLKTLSIAFLMILFPVILLLKQPDLGTATLLFLSGSILLFAAGLSRKIIFYTLSLFILSLPVMWHFLHDYQRQRIFTFLNPEKDPLGAGYHILQSKIAIGSGGVFGKGFLKGTQVHLDFLPEKHTDFILTLIAEEWGYMGVVFLVFVYAFILIFSIQIALNAPHHFGKLLALGISAMFFLYVFINIGMVTGLFPVVGVPLPFVSYGGASLISLFISFGWMMNIHINRNVRL